MIDDRFVSNSVNEILGRGGRRLRRRGRWWSGRALGVPWGRLAARGMRRLRVHA